MSYKKNFLDKVIFQVNYDRVDLLTTSINDQIKLTIEKSLNGSIVAANNVNINFTNVEQPPEIQKSIKWTLNSKDYNGSIAHDMFQVTARKYVNHQLFHDIIKEIFEQIRTIYNPKFTRTALRYINKINFPSGDTFDFNNLINERLIQPTIEYKDEGVCRSMGNIYLSDANDIKTRIIYGFFNSDFPNIMARREFILDFDCSLVFNKSSDRIEDVLIKLRNKANIFFEKSILPGLRTEMNNN